jgi:type VI secretion system FHA domain protein
MADRHRANVAAPAPAPVSVEPVRNPSPEASAGISHVAPVESKEAVDFSTILAAAGLDSVRVDPEVARDLGRILRVVVSGVMDGLRSRQEIKDEFRMRTTRFKPAAENNPLKFSEDVNQALQNLLVTRNPAYLPAVDAFEDAFVDLRSHQIAMLAGIRVAFESLLAEFEPDRMQEEFDRQLNKGLVPVKHRYWDLYREKVDKILKDRETTYRRLFGEAFVRAYEEQVRAFRDQKRGPAPDSKIPGKA